MTVQSHPQRDLIWQELHARPYVRFSGPAHVLHLTFVAGERTEAADRANLFQLREALGLAATYETPRHGIYASTIAGLGRLVLAWERHGEFAAYTFFLYELETPFRPFEFDFRKVLPAGVWGSAGDWPLVATLLAVGSESEMPDTPGGLTALFSCASRKRSRASRSS